VLLPPSGAAAAAAAAATGAAGDDSGDDGDDSEATGVELTKVVLLDVAGIVCDGAKAWAPMHRMEKIAVFMVVFY